MSSAQSVQLQRLDHAEGLPLPHYASSGAAGMDLCAAVPADAPVELVPGSRALIPTGFAMAMASGLEAQVRPRSGLALRHGITVLNAPGTIDSDYRGEVGVILINLGDKPYRIQRGDRIAQLVFAKKETVRFQEIETLEVSTRGAGGFGSTGLKHAEREEKNNASGHP